MEFVWSVVTFIGQVVEAILVMSSIITGSSHSLPAVTSSISTTAPSARFDALDKRIDENPQAACHRILIG